MIITENTLPSPEKKIISLADEREKGLFEQEIWDRAWKNSLIEKSDGPLIVLHHTAESITIGVKNTLRSLTTSYGNYTVISRLTEFIEAQSGRRLKCFEIVDDLCFERANYLANLKIDQEKEIALQKMVQEQKDAGRCNIVPFPKDVAEKIVTTDATIAPLKLFVANNSKEKHRIIERVLVNQKTGQSSQLKIAIGEKNGKGYGVLKQKHQQALELLLKAWAKQGHKISEIDGFHRGIITMSMYDLVKLINGSTGGSGFEYVESVMREMSAIWVHINESNEHGTKENQFTLISFCWREKGFHGKASSSKPGTKSEVQILISPYMTENFLMKKLRPMSLDTYLSLKDPGKKGVIKLLYNALEFALASHQTYSRKLSELPNDFGTTVYLAKSSRKRAILPTITELNGTPILEGKYILQIELEETADGDDYKLVAKKVAVA